MRDPNHLEEGDTVTRYLVIEPDGNIQEHDGPLETGDAQDIVGGDIDILPEPRDISATLIANEEGKRLGLEPNWVATGLIRHHLRSSDFVTGNVIIAGPPDGHGELTDLSGEDIATIKEAAASA